MLATACHTGSNHNRRTGLYRACKISKLLAVASSACMLQEKYERETRKGKAGRKKIESIAYQCLHFSERLLDFFLCWEVAPSPLSRATKKNLMLDVRVIFYDVYLSTSHCTYLVPACLHACVCTGRHACMTTTAAGLCHDWCLPRGKSARNLAGLGDEEFFSFVLSYYWLTWLDCLSFFCKSLSFLSRDIYFLHGLWDASVATVRVGI